MNARDADNDPLLYTAIWRDRTEALRILVDAGADVNARDHDNDPLLYTAIWRDKTGGGANSDRCWRRRERQTGQRRVAAVHGDLAAQNGGAEDSRRRWRGRECEEGQWRVAPIRSASAGHR